MWTIISGDKDFATILAYPPPHVSMIVVGAPDTNSPDQRKQLILRQLATMASQSLADTLVVLELSRVRIRRYADARATRALVRIVLAVTADARDTRTLPGRAQ